MPQPTEQLAGEPAVRALPRPADNRPYPMAF